MAALAPLSSFGGPAFSSAFPPNPRSLGGPASETAFPPNPRPPAEGEFRAP
jgi:hypothetical protein